MSWAWPLPGVRPRGPGRQLRPQRVNWLPGQVSPVRVAGPPLSQGRCTPRGSQFASEPPGLGWIPRSLCSLAKGSPCVPVEMQLKVAAVTKGESFLPGKPRFLATGTTLLGNQDHVSWQPGPLQERSEEGQEGNTRIFLNYRPDLFPHPGSGGDSLLLTHVKHHGLRAALGPLPAVTICGTSCHPCSHLLLRCPLPRFPLGSMNEAAASVLLAIVLSGADEVQTRSRCSVHTVGEEEEGEAGKGIRTVCPSAP